MSANNEGWSWLFNSTKYHYFVKGLSLCGRWMKVVEGKYAHLEEDSPDNCKLCQKRLKQRELKGSSK